MVADARFAALAASEAVESKASSALYVGIAYWIGFGVQKNTEESLAWISRSATEGSLAAFLVLEVIENPESRQETILGAFKNSSEGLTSLSRPGTCRFEHQNAEALSISSFSSADGCNPLHYLSLFEGLADHQSCPESRGWDVLKRNEIQTIFTGSQSHSRSDERGVLRAKHPESRHLPREQRLGEIVRLVSHVCRNSIQSTTTKVHYLDAQFPMTLSGTPLSFAISLNCREAIRALVHQPRTPGLSEDLTIELLELEAAVSCHQSETFRLLWSNYMSIGRAKEFIDTFIYSQRGSHLIAALAKRSCLERAILHGPDLASAQSKTIKILIASLSDLQTHRKCEPGNIELPQKVAFAKLVSEGVEQVLELGAVGIANEIRHTMSSQKVAPSFDKPDRQRIFRAALRMACSGCYDLERSKEFFRFARRCGKDLNPQFQALKTMMEQKSEVLFRSCIEDGIDVSGCDVDGRGLLHYMMSIGFYALVPMSLLISRGADPNRASGQGETPLHFAVKVGLPLLVKVLLAEGAKPFAADKSGTTILHYAVISRNAAVVTEILEALKAEGGRSRNEISLDSASDTRHRFRSPVTDGLLFEYGSIDAGDTRERTTALQIAAQNHDIEVVKILLRYGASPDARDSDGNVALHHAFKGTFKSAKDAISCCRLLSKAKTKLLPHNGEGDTPLHHAAQRHDGDSLRKILKFFVRERGCGINVQNSRGETILHQTARQISVTSVATILEFGAAPNRRDGQGRTAMHLFVQAAYLVTRLSNMRDREMKKMPEILIDGGVDFMIVDKSRDSGGYTAMEYAAINGNYLLFFHLFRIARHRLRNCVATLTWHGFTRFTRPKQWLSSAWSLSVAEEQWPMVKQLWAYHLEFDPDISLLVWPAGAHLLKFAIAMNDAQLLVRYGVGCSAESNELLRLRQLVGPQVGRSRGSDQDLANTTQPSVPTIWMGNLPSFLRSSSSSGIWSSEQVGFFEAWVKRRDVHRGGNPLNEIFGFMATLD